MTTSDSHDELEFRVPTDEEMDAMYAFFGEDCACGHHERAHMGGGLCGAPAGCHCTRFRSERFRAQPSRLPGGAH